MAAPARSIEQLRQAQDVDAIPTLAWSARPDGSAEFLNRRWLDYTGLSAEEALNWGWTAAVHTEDRDRLMAFWRHVLASGEAGKIERYWIPLLGLAGIGIDLPFRVGKFGAALIGLGFLFPIWLFVFVVVLLMVILADQILKLKNQRNAAANSERED
jgi:PAS domain-containing protein